MYLHYIKIIALIKELHGRLQFSGILDLLNISSIQHKFLLMFFINLLATKRYYVLDILV